MDNDTSYVAIERCDGYSQDLVFSTLENVCEAACMPDVAGKKVLVKPNILSDSRPEDCITTHPEVVRAVIRLLKKKGASEVYVGDSPGLHSPSFRARNCGIGLVCDEEGAIWCDFTQDPVTKRINGTRHRLPMAAILDKVDLVFSVCKFKTHTLMYTTGAVKNLFGTIPNINKGACHVLAPSRESFARLIAGIHETIKPAFCIMDAVIGMEGAGPANGTPRAVNLLMASDNCFAMDQTQAILMGYRVNDIPVLNEARKRHIMPKTIEYPLLQAQDLVMTDYKRVEVSERTHFIARLVLPFLTRGFQKRRQRKEPAPQFIDEKCIRCQRCVNICPAKALTLQASEGEAIGPETIKAENRKVHIVCDYTKCIRCYCCHEMCPVNAIHIGKENP